VLCDDQPVNTCMVPAAAVHGRRLTTLEGLLGDELMVTLQREMVERGGIQCGYCTPGMLISFYALLKENGRPSNEEIRESLTGNLCRCTGYVKPVEAVLAVVKERDQTGGQAE
jgi:aerobic-type carbon monoxide dehydrogenase small subunit (CoxS/CutS family)